MFTATKTPEAKRAKFRADLASGQLQRLPGAFAPIVAMKLQDMGFEGIYISGAALSAEMGLPDIGLTTLTEVAQRSYQIARTVDLPLLVDADTGFGEPMSAARTVQVFEEHGLAGCHIEDQVAPKRCGHLDNKAVVETAGMVQRIRAAVGAKRDPNFLVMARSDARAIEGLDKTIDRLKAYVDAGADAIFPEALTDEREFEAVRRAIAVPLLANMTEFGKSKMLTVKELEALGYNIVIWPVSTLRLAMKAIELGMEALLAEGSLEGQLGAMQHRAELYALLRYERYNAFDRELFNFKVAR